MTEADRDQKNKHTGAMHSRKIDGTPTDHRSRAERKVDTAGEGVAPPSFEVDWLRGGLFELYREDVRFQALVRQDLRPVWLEAYHGPGGDQLLWAILDSPSNGNRHTTDWRDWQSFWHHPTTVGYIRLMRTVGPLRLHLSDQKTGETPYWLVPWIHMEVAASEFRRNDIHPLHTNERLVQGLAPWQGLSILLSITADSVTLGLDGADNILTGSKPEGFIYGLDVESRECKPSIGVLYDAEHWRRLEEASVDLLRHGLRAMRADLEYRYPRRRPSAVQRNREDLLPLFDWLFHRTRPIDRANRQRLRRLSRLLGLAPPEPSQQAYVSLPGDLDSHVISTNP